MEDLAHSEVLGRVVGTMYGRGRLIIADCHGPACPLQDITLQVEILLRRRTLA
jgi:hypothetical protein